LFALLKKGQNGLEIGETSWKIQSDHQQKKIRQPSIGDFGFGQKSESLR